MDFIYIFIILICIAILYKYAENSTYAVVYTKSAVNGKTYLVRNLPDKDKAADLLAHLNNTFDEVIGYLKQQEKITLYKLYVVKDRTLTLDKLNDKHNINMKKQYNTFCEDIDRLISNYRTDSLSENTPDSAYTAYSENKGQKIVFCLRDKQTDALVDLNTMTFVALHELSHLMTKTIGHGQDFWDNFRIILRIGIRNGVYTCVDYNKNHEMYCGTNITDNPIKCGDVI